MKKRNFYIDTTHHSFLRKVVYTDVIPLLSSFVGMGAGIILGQTFAPEYTGITMTATACASLHLGMTVNRAIDKHLDADEQYIMALC